MATIAEVVDEWFQGEPTVERQQNMRRTHLVRDLEILFAKRLEELAGHIEDARITSAPSDWRGLEKAADLVRKVGA